MAQNQQEIAGGEEKYPRYRWVMIGLLWLTQEIMVLLPGGLGMLLPAMREALGFGVAQAGVLGSVVQLPRALLSIPAGLLLVRFSSKRVYIGILAVATVAALLCGQAPVFALLAVGLFLIGAAMAIREVPDALLRLQWIPRKQFATIMGITMGLVATGQSMSIILIPFLLAVLGNWRNLFSAYTGALLILTIIWMVLGRQRITPAYREGMSSQAGRAPLRGVLKRKEFLILGFCVPGTTLAYMSTLLFLPTYLLEERGMTLTTIGLIVGLMPIGGACANLSMGFISDRIGLRKPTIWPSGLISPPLYFILFSPIPVWALPVLTFLAGYVAWTPFAAMRSIPYELPGIKPSEVAVGQTLINTITSLGAIIGAPLVGYLAEMTGSLGTALRVISFFPLTIAITWFLLPETGPKARPKGREKDKGSEVD